MASLKTCENCGNCHTEYMLGDYPTPVCTLHGYLEELDNPYHNIGEKCPDFTYLPLAFRGLREKIKPIDDKIPDKLRTAINEILLLEELLN